MIAIKKIVCYTPKSLEKKACQAMQGQRGSTRVKVGCRGHEGKMWARAFPVGSVGRSGGGRASRIRIGKFEQFQQTREHKGCPE